MEIAQRLDEYGKPAWITVMVLGFVLFWPVGLAVLFYLLWSGRMGSWKCRGRKAWRRAGLHRPTGNAAFDEYRDETLQRLEEEQREFSSFLERLRHAKDKAEFDQFMKERRASADGEPGNGTAGATGAAA